MLPTTAQGWHQRRLRNLAALRELHRRVNLVLRFEGEPSQPSSEVTPRMLKETLDTLRLHLSGDPAAVRRERLWSALPERAQRRERDRLGNLHRAPGTFPPRRPRG